MRSYSFSNIFLKTLRDNRAGIVAWGGGMALLVATGAAQYSQVVGAVGPEREKMAQEAAKAFQAFSFLMGDITALDTLGGFITTRVMGFIPLVVGLWAAVVGAGLIRGEEQGGALDVLLSTPHSRRSVLWQKAAALGVSIVAVTLVMLLGLWLGSVATNEPLAVGNLMLTLLNVVAVVGFWGAVGLLVGQFTSTRRAASGITGALIFATYLLNNIFGGTPSLQWLSWLMPFHYYTISKPLVPGRGREWGAWAVMLAGVAVVMALTRVLFMRRDIGSVFPLFRRARPERAASRRAMWLLGSVLGKNIRDLALPTLAWAAGLGLYAALIVSTTTQALEPLRQILSKAGAVALVFGNLATNEAYLSIGLFIYLPVLLAVFSITQIISWADDEEEGRLELLAAMPRPRIELMLARYLPILAALTVIVVVTGGAALLSAGAAGISLNGNRLMEALFAAILPSFAVAAFGLCAATWFKRPGAAVPLTIGLVVVMFFLEIFAPLLNLPDAVLNLSIFHLYGRPLTEGVKWAGLLALVVASLVLCAGGLAGLNRRDIAK